MMRSKASLQLLAAFAAIYLIWGSTYLAIVFAIESIPPFLMLGARFGVAGLLVYLWARNKGIATPNRKEWRNAAVVGTMTLGAGTGAVAWAEQWVPSGIAALLVTTVPIWMVLLEWKWRGGGRPGSRIWAGLLLGVIGIVLLVDPNGAAFAGRGMLWGSVAILAAAATFSAGAILGRDLDLPQRPLMSTAAQMITGGASLTVFGLLTGEMGRLDVDGITTTSFLAWAYLMAFGSIIAYGSFVWLMKNAPPARVSTYAYVNPVVAVFLGWLLGGEVLNLRILLAVAFLLSAVLLISRRRRGWKVPQRLVNRGGAILAAFSHALDPAALSAPRRRARSPRFEHVALRPGVRVVHCAPEHGGHITEVSVER